MGNSCCNQSDYTHSDLSANPKIKKTIRSSPENRESLGSNSHQEKNDNKNKIYESKWVEDEEDTNKWVKEEENTNKWVEEEKNTNKWVKEGQYTNLNYQIADMPINYIHKMEEYITPELRQAYFKMKQNSLKIPGSYEGITNPYTPNVLEIETFVENEKIYYFGQVKPTDYIKPFGIGCMLKINKNSKSIKNNSSQIYYEGLFDSEGKFFFGCKVTNDEYLQGNFEADQLNNQGLMINENGVYKGVFDKGVFKEGTLTKGDEVWEGKFKGKMLDCINGIILLLI